MRIFSVWAPNATSTTLCVGDADVPMGAVGDGWWRVDVDCAETGVDYGFRIDNGPVRPDPRSRRQPHGVHERSRTFDVSAYRWNDSAWRGLPLSGAVIYELHIGTFTHGGTLDSAIERLDYLAALGVSLVEVLPVNAFNGVWNWGYDGVLWFAVHEAYGGPAAYQRFVDACHARGLGVVQDVVYNHLGASGNYLPEFGPYLHHDAANTWGDSVNLDGAGSDEVRRYILDNARMWFTDYHVDGLRLDAVHALSDSRAMPLLEELAVETDALAAHLGRPLHLIAESDLNAPRLFAPHAHGGMGLTASWDDDIHHAIHAAVTGETSGYYTDFAPLSALAKVLQRGYFHDGTYSSFRGRSHGRPIDTDVVPPWRLVASIQNHDQIGNRASGDRMAQQAGYAAQAIAAVLLLTAPFTPMLFMGEEWAASTPWPFFTSHPEEDLAEKTRAGRLAEFSRHGWDPASVPDPQDPGTFARAALDWKESAVGEHASMLALYRELLGFRRSHPDIVSAPWSDMRIEFSEAERWLVVYRACFAVVVNLAEHAQHVTLRRDGDHLSGRVIFTTEAGTEITDAEVGGREMHGSEIGCSAVRLPPMAAALIE
ncbi:MAG: malto-oligosyltrehalose trehalohydrolase [Nakamurella sp.]